ncbi:MAG: hypothetical protein R3C32_07670 [Chloroflexota bacterium]
MTNASAYEAYAEQDAEEARLIQQDQDALDSMRSRRRPVIARTSWRRAEEAAAQDLRDGRTELNAAREKAVRLERKVKALKARQLARAHRIARNKRQAEGDRARARAPRSASTDDQGPRTRGM